MKSVLILLCGVLTVDSQSSPSISGPAVETEFMFSEDIIKDQLANGDELALIKINSVQELHPGKKSHMTEYSATILKSAQEKRSRWSWLGLPRKETFWQWGPPQLDKGIYLAAIGERQKDGRIPIDATGSTRKNPENRSDEVFATYRKAAEQILSQLKILPDTALSAAAKGILDIAVLRITYAVPAKDSASSASVLTDYRATALSWLAGNEGENVAPLLLGTYSLKQNRIYLVAFSANLKVPQPMIAVEVFPGNLEKSIRMHQEKIRTLGKKIDAGAP